MRGSFEYYQNIAKEMDGIPSGSILSKALTTNDKVKVTLFGFAEGQELTEHTAAYPAILHFLAGEADLRLGDEKLKVDAGSWAYMPAKLPHSLVARTPVSMLLIMIVA
ncbi:MAG: cupin domain-containing protein [Anaerolineaceae bacterium]|nr:cupin domain-containing protein [Anaerolineaceae bacterium]MBN2677431.1 cupin domain-containing protein [Anaerolineaceae bacterium]